MKPLGGFTQEELNEIWDSLSTDKPNSAANLVNHESFGSLTINPYLETLNNSYNPTFGLGK